LSRSSPFHIVLTRQEQEKLEIRARKYTSPYRDVIRAKIVLLAAQGLSNDVIAMRLDTPRQIVSKWRKRFALARLPGLEEQPRGGRPGLFSPQRRGSSKGPSRVSFLIVWGSRSPDSPSPISDRRWWRKAGWLRSAARPCGVG